MEEDALKRINSKLKSDFKLVKQFDSGIANLNYLLRSSSGVEIVARILRDQKPENINLEFKLQKALIANGINTPLFLELRGAPILIESGTDFITLTKYIESDSIRHKDLKRSREFLKEIGLTLAKVQSALKDFPYKSVPPNYLHPEYQQKYNFSKEETPTSEAIKNVIDRLYILFEDLKLPKTLIHGDLNDGNYLTQGNKITAVLDLETSEHNFRILDISAAIYYTHPSSGLSYSEVSKLIIEGFESLLKLSEEEIQTIPKAVQYNAACFSLWSLANEKGQVSLEGPGKNDAQEYDFLKGFQDLQERIRKGFEIN